MFYCAWPASERQVVVSAAAERSLASKASGIICTWKTLLGCCVQLYGAMCLCVLIVCLFGEQ